MVLTRITKQRVKFLTCSVQLCGLRPDAGEGRRDQESGVGIGGHRHVDWIVLGRWVIMSHPRLPVIFGVVRGFWGWTFLAGGCRVPHISDGCCHQFCLAKRNL